MAKWRFDDPTNGDFYVFEISPNEGGSAALSKNVLQKGVAAGGRTLLFEGSDNPPGFDFKGTILSQAQYDAMVLWFNKRHIIQVTDDLGRQTYIYIVGFDPTRERANSHPWKHSYSVKAFRA